jgi:hypothetical protein
MGGQSLFGVLRLALLAAAAAENFGSPQKAPFVRRQDLPAGSEWVSLADGTMEFMPAGDMRHLGIPRAPLLNFGRPPRGGGRRRRRQRKLDEDYYVEEGEEGGDEDGGDETDDNLQYRVQPFVEGVSDYDEAQQAWRLLGFMIDCNDPYSTDDDASGSGDNDYNTGEGCARYVLWAAYVDLEYQGGGLGEYQYWDRYDNKWNDKPCQYDQNGPYARCAKMDCHLEDTHWSLLGFFKHKSIINDWMEQLFKHEGVCVWDDTQYGFMAAAREQWPSGCIATSTTDKAGNTIYYDVKPVHGGGITLGLYTDTRCVKEYQTTGKSDPITPENVIGNILSQGEASGSGDYEQVVYDTLEESLEAWDDAFDAFKICQPCLAHDLNNVGYNYDDDSMHGSSYGTYNYGYDDDGYSYGDAADFDCCTYY